MSPSEPSTTTTQCVAETSSLNENKEVMGDNPGCDEVLPQNSDNVKQATHDGSESSKMERIVNELEGVVVGADHLPAKDKVGADENCAPPQGDNVTSTNKAGRHVSFSTVQIREYQQTFGLNPFCSYGCPISLDWGYEELDEEDLQEYEANRAPRRSRHGMLLSYYQRRDTLLLSGHSMEDLDRAARDSGRERFRREVTVSILPLFILEEKLVLKAHSLFGSTGVPPDISSSEATTQMEARDIEKGNRSIFRRTKSALDSSLHSIRNLDSSIHSLTDSFRDSLSPTLHRRSTGQQKYMRRSLSDAEAMQLSHEESCRSSNSNFGGDGSGATSSDLYVASQDSNFKGRYHVRVDRSQLDKAIEVRLCQMKRPHMRAFHASWISFFTAFFLWFAVTPLLGEIKETLTLSKEQIWTSSLCGTAGTILMRLILGPLCDKFGARLCMASILLISALPCAMTGLIESAEGLYIARAFIGIAGASFVACQYWTSSMFTREVAGTANALVAGWVSNDICRNMALPFFRVYFILLNFTFIHVPYAIFRETLVAGLLRL